MKTRILFTVLLLSTLALMAGCRTNPVYNVQDQTIATNITSPTEEDVKKAIIRAGAGLGWIMSADRPGHILATLHIREHLAAADISYDLKKYSITYKDSTNLKYDNADGTPTIHQNYNSWIQNLDRAIQTQLSAI